MSIPENLEQYLADIKMPWIWNEWPDFGCGFSKDRVPGITNRELTEYMITTVERQGVPVPEVVRRRLRWLMAVEPIMRRPSIYQFEFIPQSGDMSGRFVPERVRHAGHAIDIVESMDLTTPYFRVGVLHGPILQYGTLERLLRMECGYRDLIDIVAIRNAVKKREADEAENDKTAKKIKNEFLKIFRRY